MAGAATLLQFPPAERANHFHQNTPLKRIGVRTAEDDIHPQGVDIFRHRATSPLSISNLDATPSELGCEAIYGGVIGPQFGHVVSQSIGRLWVAEKLPPHLPIIFLNATPGFDAMPRYFVDLAGLLGVANPLLLITEPTRIASLHLGPDLCNLERRPAAEQHFLDWLQRNRPAVPVDPELRIYVSRSRLGRHYEQYLEEAALEAALEAEGYRVVYPEKLTVLDQIELYLRAGRLIFADGSAVHLWSLFATAAQRGAIILRRPWTRTFRLWFKSFDMAPIHRIDRLVARFSGKGAQGRHPAILLDMPQVWRDLGEAGFHSCSRQLNGAADWVRRGEGDAYAWDELSATLLATRPNLVWTGASSADRTALP